MNIVTKIYGLVNPVSGEIFYLGCTSRSLHQRLIDHKTDSRKKNTPKARYIKWIQWMGLQPEITELDTLINATAEEIREKEQAYIDFYGLTRDLANSATSAYVGCGQNNTVEWPEHIVKKLGTIPDWEIAKEISCARKTVNNMRVKLGIPKCGNREEFRKMPIVAGWNKITLPQSIIDKMGSMPDYKLAELAGVSKSVIARNRRALGIESYAQKTGNDGKAKKGDYPKRWLKRERDLQKDVS